MVLYLYEGPNAKEPTEYDKCVCKAFQDTFSPEDVEYYFMNKEYALRRKTLLKALALDSKNPSKELMEELRKLYYEHYDLYRLIEELENEKEEFEFEGDEFPEEETRLLEYAKDYVEAAYIIYSTEEHTDDDEDDDEDYDEYDDEVDEYDPSDYYDCYDYYDDYYDEDYKYEPENSKSKAVKHTVTSSGYTDYYQVLREQDMLDTPEYF